MPLINQVSANSAVARNTAGVGAAADREVVEELMREVRQIARLACKKVPGHVRIDIESAAMVGLMEALRHFDEMDTRHFHRYLRVRVRGAIRDEARHFDPLSRTERRLVRQVERVTQEHRKRFGHAPEMQQVAEALDCDEDECWNALELSAFAMSPIVDEAISSDVITPEDAFVCSYSAAALRWGLARLDKRERLVLRLAYKRGLPLAVIAARLDVSIPRVHQIRVQAERRLARLVRNSPALAELSGAESPFDWDESTDDMFRDSAFTATAAMNPKPEVT